MTDPAEHIVRLREALRRRIGLPLGGEIEDAIAQVTDVLEAAQKEIDLLRKPNSATIVLDSYAAENKRLFDRAEKAESALEAAQARIAQLKQMDREAATYVESVICMRTHFTGDEPYVGWKGLGLALDETLDRHESALAQAVRDEREACARIADNEATTSKDVYTGSFRCRSIAAAIRARSKGEG